MEPAWEKDTVLNFQLSTYKDSTSRTLPCYSLSKTEVATKFNDEARAHSLQQALKLMSSPFTEWVSAPTEMKSTPCSA